MTIKNAEKQLARERMQKTGESYTAALAQVRRARPSGTVEDLPLDGRGPGDPPFDRSAEQLVRLHPVRLASFVGEGLLRTERNQFVLPSWLVGAQLEIAERIVMNFRPLTEGFTAASPEDQAEAILELQGDLDDLFSAGLVLAIGDAEIVVLQALPIAPRRTPTLVVGFTRPGGPAPVVVMPLVTDWFGKAVKR